MTRHYLRKSIPVEKLAPDQSDQLSTFDKLKAVLVERVRTAPKEKAREAAERELKEILGSSRKRQPAA